MSLRSFVWYHFPTRGFAIRRIIIILGLITIIFFTFAYKIPTTGRFEVDNTSYDEDEIERADYRVSKTNANHIYSLGDEETFDVWQFVDRDYIKVTAVCKVISEETYIFCDKKINIGFNFTGLAEKVDNVMMPILVNNFAEPTDRDGNNKVVLLLTNIQGSVAGYFSPSDYYSYGEIVYLDLEFGISESTAIHELQHLVHHGFDPYEKIWFNEGCSKFSELLLDIAMGYNKSQSVYYPTGTSLLYWNYDIPGGNYRAAQTFICYLYDQYGNANLSAIYRASSGGVKLQSYSAIMSVLKQYYPTLTFEKLYTNWIIANTIDSRYNGTTREYYYKSFKVYPNYYSFPETGLFAKTYPYDNTVKIYPWATNVYNFRDFPDPNNISIEIDIPVDSQEHTFAVNLIKETMINKYYSDFSIESIFLTESNISEGIKWSLNQSSENFDKLYLTISHTDGGLGGYFQDIPVSERNVKYHLKVISQKTNSSTQATNHSISVEKTDFDFFYFSLLTLAFVVLLRKRNHLR